MLTSIARIARRLVSRFAPTTTAAPRPFGTPGLRFRPRMEGLEAREVLATCVWVGLTDDAGDPSNWNVDDPLHPNRLPHNGDDIVFTDAYGSTASCRNFDGTAGIGDHFRSVTLDETFTGAVATPWGFYTEILELKGGRLEQPTLPGQEPPEDPYLGAINQSQIVVTSYFQWTGGILNSGPDLGSLMVSGEAEGGATAEIDPGVGNTLSTGSVLAFWGTAALAPVNAVVKPGTVDFRNAAGAVVGAFATLKPSTVQQGDVVGFATQGASQVTVLGGGLFDVIGPGSFASDLPFYVNGGTFRVRGAAAANLSGAFGPDFRPGAGIGNSMLVDSGGQLIIQNGSALNVTNGVTLSSGVLGTQANPQLAANAQVATIGGNVTNTGADVVICAADLDPPNTPHTYGTLKVVGAVNWLGGTYRPVVDASTMNVRDLWLATDRFSVTPGPNDTGARLAPGTLNGVPMANAHYQFLKGNAIVGNAPAVESPTVQYAAVLGDLDPNDPMKVIGWSLEPA